MALRLLAAAAGRRGAGAATAGLNGTVEALWQRGLPAAVVAALQTSTSSSTSSSSYATEAWRNVQISRPYNIHEYNQRIFYLSRQKMAYLMVDVVRDMMADGVTPTRDTFHMCIAACMRAGRLQEVFYYFDLMKRLALTPDLILYNTVMSACAKARQPDAAFQVFEEILRSGQKPTVRSYTSLLSACAISGSVQKAEEVMDWMRNDGFPTNLFHISVMMLAYANERPSRSDAVPRVFKLLEQAQQIQADELDTGDAQQDDAELTRDEFDGEEKYTSKFNMTLLYNRALQTCTELRNHQAVLQLIEDMDKNGIAKDGTTYHALTRSYMHNGEYDAAIAAFESFRGTRYIPSLDLCTRLLRRGLVLNTPSSLAGCETVMKAMQEVQYFLNVGDGTDILEAACTANADAVADTVWKLLRSRKRFPRQIACSKYYTRLQERGEADEELLEEVEKATLHSHRRMYSSTGQEKGPGDEAEPSGQHDDAAQGSESSQPDQTKNEPVVESDAGHQADERSETVASQQ
eukprot:jgi/Chlat1/2132/Chrsp17S02708